MIVKVSVLIILAKLELTLVMIVMSHVHVVLRLTKMLWLALIVLFSLTALYKPSASQNCSLIVRSLSSTTPSGEYIHLCVLLHFIGYR